MQALLTGSTRQNEGLQ